MSITALGLAGVAGVNAAASAASSPDNIITSWKDALSGGQYSADKSAKTAYATQTALNKAANENYEESYKSQVAAMKAAGINPAGSGAGLAGVSQGGNQMGSSGTRVASGLNSNPFNLDQLLKMSMEQTALKHKDDLIDMMKDKTKAQIKKLDKDIDVSERKLNLAWAKYEDRGLTSDWYLSKKGDYYFYLSNMLKRKLGES